MSKYTMKDMQEAQYAMQFYDSMQKRITELETENKHLRTALAIRTTYDQITAEITRIWNEIPAECKKENSTPQES